MIFIKNPFLDLEKKLLASIQLFEVDGESLHRRLEFISKHNLELFTHFERLQKTHELIEKNLLVKAKETIERCRNWVEKRDSKSFSVHYDDSKVSVNLCVTSIRKWLDELKTIMEPEMIMKGKIAETKDHLRALRVAYFKHANALQYVENKFVYAFKTFDDRMLDIEKWLDSGNYEDIDVQLTKLKKVAIKLIDLTDGLPPLCAWISSILPEKITQLKQTAETMVKSGFPIHHLLVNDTVTKIEDELVLLDQKLQAFDLVGLDVAFKDMLEKIDSFYPLFEKEKAAQLMVEADYETTYERVNRLEKVFAKLNADLPRIKQSYVLEDARLQSVDTIQHLISELNRIKRGLDTLVLSGTKQPLSLQLDKIRTLNANADEAETMMNDFSAYVHSLKQLAKDEMNRAQRYFERLKSMEHAWSNLRIAKLDHVHDGMMHQCYQRLQNMMDALRKLPIDMNIVHENVRFLQEEGEPFLVNVEETLTQATRAETALLKANYQRHRTTDHQRLISLAESKFFEGRFQEVFQEVEALLKRLPEEVPQLKNKKTR